MVNQKLISASFLVVLCLGIFCIKCADSQGSETDSPCAERERQCNGQVLQHCVDGVWQDFDNCAAQGKTCYISAGIYNCYEAAANDDDGSTGVGGNSEVDSEPEETSTANHDSVTNKVDDTSEQAESDDIESKDESAPEDNDEDKDETDSEEEDVLDEESNDVTDDDSDANRTNGQETDASSELGSGTDSSTLIEQDSETETTADSDATCPSEVNMLILFDRSATTDMNDIEGETFLTGVSAAISGWVTNPSNASINFGLSVFPSLDCLISGATSFEQLCQPADDSQVDIGSQTGDDIEAFLGTLEACGGAPLCESLKFVREYFDSLGATEFDEHPNYVLLVADGPPNCNPDLDIALCENSSLDPELIVEDSVQCADSDCVRDAAEALYLDEVETIVVGVGDDALGFEHVLERIAEEGSGDTRDPYMVSSWSALDVALEEIAATVTACD